MKGMRDKFTKGIWVVRAPIGYDIVRVNDDRKIVINETGKKLRKAFVWKSEGFKNAEIIMRLQGMGIPMYKQQLTKIFKNPFYCGLIVHGLLDGEVVEGKHEALISKNLFLKVNNIHKSQSGYGVPHKKEQDEIPLKVFMLSSVCGVPFTGYEVKKKGLWYYKCRTTGCRCNRNAQEVHSLFIELLSNYSIKEHLTTPLMEKMKLLWKVINKDAVESEKELKKRLIDIENKIENVEEGYYVNKDMSKEIFEKFYGKSNKERQEIHIQLTQSTEKISNPDFAISKALRLSTELSTVWTSSDIKKKERLQKLVFPEGIVYDRKNNAFRTPKINIIFELIAGLKRITGDEKRDKLMIFIVCPL